MNLRLSKKKKKLFLAIGIGVSVFFASILSAPLQRESVFALIKHPLTLIGLIRREAGALIFYHHHFTEHRRLLRENGDLQQQLIARGGMERENQRLRAMLDLKEEALYRMIAARVIGHPPDLWSSGIIIDKGSARGIAVGMPVVTHVGLIGRVVEVTAGVSKVMLISDPSVGVSGMVDRSRQEGLITGTLGGNLIMKYLPQEADIEIGDIVVTSGLNGKYPKGILIGTVLEVRTEFSGLSLYAVVRPAVNLSNIEEVLVVGQ